MEVDEFEPSHAGLFKPKKLNLTFRDAFTFKLFFCFELLVKLGNLLQMWTIIFDCCKKSLTRLYHPSIRPSIQDHTFWQKRSNCKFTIYINSHLVQITRQARTFLLQTLRRKCSKFSTSNFTILLWLFFRFLKIRKI